MSRIEANVATEKQFLIRLPQDKATIVRQAIASGQPVEERVQIESLGSSRGGLVRHARVQVDNHLLLGKMMDLPCVVESHKSLDTKTLYKTGDISQMLVCTDSTEDEVKKLESELDSAPSHRESRKQFVCNYGLTPPLKNVRKKRFRRTAPKKFLDMETPEVEKEVRRLLREDLQAVNVSFNVVSDEKPTSKRTDDEGAEEDGEDLYHGDLYAELQLSSTDDSSDGSLYGSDASGDDADLGMDTADDVSAAVAASSMDMTPQQESPQVLALRRELDEVEQMIDNQEMRVKSQSNPFLKERFLQRLTDLKSKRVSLLDKSTNHRVVNCGRSGGIADGIFEIAEYHH